MPYDNDDDGGTIIKQYNTLLVIKVEYFLKFESFHIHHYNSNTNFTLKIKFGHSVIEYRLLNLNEKSTVVEHVMLH